MSMAFFGWITPYSTRTDNDETELVVSESAKFEPEPDSSRTSLLADAMSFQRQRNQRVLRPVAIATLLFTAWLLFPRTVFAKKIEYKGYSQLEGTGKTQTPDAELRAKIDAREKAEQAKTATPKSDVELLSASDMKSIRGRGQYRNKYFSGTMPWQRSLRDVNLCNGNLFKNFTDVPHRDAGRV